MSSANDIRSTFIDYFTRHGHAPVPSAPLVPIGDPTLLFTNAGMVPFKHLFTGQERREYVRAVSSQKCVRAGGKHNDLENVGHTARHHTFFEMLGNFSFGDYFKAEAIDYAWKLVTGDFGLPAERLLVTVYAEDDEAHALWRKIAGLPDSRIIRIATSDNFWQMGETGPCGPCSEIFYDHGPEIPGGPPGSPDEDGDRFIEIWNLVFMQYDQRAGGERVDLPSPSIDTGMGLERVSAILQGCHDNYDIDLFRALIEASANLTGKEPDGPHRVSHRVIADHLRSAAFLIADGVLPSNEGRGYVLRRIMRRGMRHANLLGADQPLMWRLVPELIRQMGSAYGELGRAEALITETLKLEETRFRQTLERGLKLLEEATDRLGEGEALPGDVAFKLYDTYGFPLDLTEDVLRGQGRHVDHAGFEAAMAAQRAEARKAWSGSGESATEEQWFALRDRIGATEFVGYTAEIADGVVTALLVDGAEQDRARAGSEIALVTNQTPFYGESGGQIGDAGTLVGDDGLVVSITDTQKKLGDVIVHLGKVEAGEIAVGDTVTLAIDAGRRASVKRNHSATHLLHEALRQQLGEHVTQKGSFVGPDRLRFDFAHPAAISEADRAAIEAMVNHRILLNQDVGTRLMAIDEALQAGAMALFGEKYGDEVRVVAIGGPDDGKQGRDYSVELCGGTHVARTGDIGPFRIISESAVSSGVRRIEAVTGEGALAWFHEREQMLVAAAASLKAPPIEVPARVTALLEERRKLEREIAELRKQLAAGGGAGAGPVIRDLGGLAFAPRLLNGVPPKELKPMADALKQKMGSGIALLIADNDGKASVVVGVTDDLTARFSAVDLVRVAAEALGGKGGGGRADMAQAGGPDAGKADAAIAAVEAVLVKAEAA